MGLEQSTHSEENFEKLRTTEIEATADKSSAVDTPEEVPNDPKASTLTSLGVLLADIASPMEEWLAEAFRRVLGRFGRMPRNGWSCVRSVYCGKFGVDMPLPRLKEKAMNVLTTESGRRCSAREFKNEAVKRVKTLDVIFEEKTLLEAKVYNNAKKIFSECIQEVSSVEVDKAERIRKVSSEKINHLVLEAVARALSEYSHSKPPSDMTEIARIIQTGQIAYMRLAQKPSHVSTWQASIEKKIEALKALVALLERVIRLEKLDKVDKSKVSAFMSQEKLKMGSAIDAREAISRCNERVLVYARKIEMHHKRKAFSRENASFELYRRQFYRSLEGAETPQHQVASADIKAFWETMWTKRPDESNGTGLETYLVEHLSGEEPFDVFPTFEEFREVVKLVK